MWKRSLSNAQPSIVLVSLIVRRQITVSPAVPMTDSSLRPWTKLSILVIFFLMKLLNDKQLMKQNPNISYLKLKVSHPTQSHSHQNPVSYSQNPSRSSVIQSIFQFYFTCLNEWFERFSKRTILPLVDENDPCKSQSRLISVQSRVTTFLSCWSCKNKNIFKNIDFFPLFFFLNCSQQKE